MRPRVLPLVIGAVAAGSFAIQAHALWNQQVELFASATYGYDDNVFRLSDDEDPLTEIGSSDEGSAFWTLAAGLNFDVPQGAQRFVGQVAVDRNEFDRFSQFDFTGHEAEAAWQWQVADWAAGELGYGDWERLASPANLQNGVQSADPNFLDGKRVFFTATNSRVSRWQASAGAGYFEQSNSSPDFSLSDIEATSGELSLAYVTPAASRLGVGARMIDADLPNQQDIAGVLIDNSFQQENYFAFVEWPVTTTSLINLSAGPVERDYDDLPERDDDTFAWRARYQWLPTEDVTLNFIVERDISTEEAVTVGHILREQILVRALWRQSEKIEWRAQAGYADRTYLGQAPQVLLGEPPREEDVFDAEVRMSWQMTQLLALDVAARYLTRDSQIELDEYDASIVSVGLRVVY